MRFRVGLLLVLVVGALIGVLGAHGLLPTFAEVRAGRMEIETFLMEMPVLGALIFSLGYILVVALSIPVATVLTVLAGFLFGSVLGTVLVVTAATIGASLLFLLVRFFFRDVVSTRFDSRLEVVNRELADNGFRDVLLLRLAPVIPFALINVGAALTSVRFRDYALATLIGITPFTFVYVHAGTRLAEIERVSDIVAPQTLLAVSLLVFASFISIVARRARLRDV